MMSQLALYNARLLAIVSRCWLNAPFRNYFVSSAQLVGHMVALSNMIQERNPEEDEDA